MSPASSASRVAEFWQRLYGEGRGFFALASQTPGGAWGEGPFFRWPDDLDEALTEVGKLAARRNVWQSVNLFRTATRKEALIEQVRVLYTDDKADFEAAPASIIIRTSTDKVQGYWLLREPVTLERARELQARLVAHVGGDLGAKDLARVLRVPGTVNRKKAYADAPPAVEIVSLEPERLYDADELDRLLPEIPRNLSQSIPQTEIDRLLQGPIQDGERHNAAKVLAAHFVGLGTPERAVRETLRGWVQTACVPPGDDVHVQKIVSWALEQERLKAAAGEDPAAFPEEAYVGLGADFVELYVRHTKASRQFLYFSFLTCLGHLLSDRLVMPFVDPQTPRLYTILVGPTGEGKSTAKRLAVDVFARANAEFAGTLMHGTGSGEGIAARLASKDGLPKKVLLVVDELSGLIEKARAEGSILLPVLSSLYEDLHFDNTTVRGGTISVRDGFLSLLTATTPVRYETIWKSEFIRIGFTNRVWLAWDTATDANHATPGEVDPADRDVFVSRLQDATEDLLAAPHKTTVHMSPPAGVAWETWYRSRMDGSVHTTRLDVQGWRLMMLLAVCRGERNGAGYAISQDTVGRVCAMLDHQLDLRRRHDPIDADTAMATMEERIRRALNTRGPLTRRTLMQVVHANRAGLWFFEAALDNLTKAKEVGFDGRSKTFALRPVAAPVATPP